jgi:hypothetical protein
MTTKGGEPAEDDRKSSISGFEDADVGGIGGKGHHESRPRHVHVKGFSGDRRPGVYREWRKDVLVTQLAYDVKGDQMGSLVYLALTNGAKDIITQEIEIDDLRSDDALFAIFKILDKEFFKAPHEQADAAFRRFEQTRRRASQPMEEYLLELKQVKNMLKKEDPGSDISDISMARRTLRRSGLTMVEQRLVLSAAGAKWDLDAIESALRLMFNDAHHEDRKRSPKGPGKGHAPAHHGHHGPDKGHTMIYKGKGKGKGKGIYANEDPE